jgi:hypothetical protein
LIVDVPHGKQVEAEHESIKHIRPNLRKENGVALVHLESSDNDSDVPKVEVK